MAFADKKTSHWTMWQQQVKEFLHQQMLTLDTLQKKKTDLILQLKFRRDKNGGKKMYRKLCVACMKYTALDDEISLLIHQKTEMDAKLTKISDRLLLSQKTLKADAGEKAADHAYFRSLDSATVGCDKMWLSIRQLRSNISFLLNLQKRLHVHCKRFENVLSDQKVALMRMAYCLSFSVAKKKQIDAKISACQEKHRFECERLSQQIRVFARKAENVKQFRNFLLMKEDRNSFQIGFSAEGSKHRYKNSSSLLTEETDSAVHGTCQKYTKCRHETGNIKKGIEETSSEIGRELVALQMAKRFSESGVEVDKVSVKLQPTTKNMEDNVSVCTEGSTEIERRNKDHCMLKSIVFINSYETNQPSTSETEVCGKVIMEVFSDTPVSLEKSHESGIYSPFKDDTVAEFMKILEKYIFDLLLIHSYLQSKALHYRRICLL